MRRHWLRLGVVAGLLLAALTYASPLRAADGDVVITGVDGDSCPSGSATVYATFNLAAGGDRSSVALLNITRETQSDLLSGDLSGTYSLPYPAGTRAGDELEFVVAYYRARPLDIDRAYFQCPEKPPPDPPYTGIWLLGSTEAQAMYMAVPDANGATACGVFDVNGWGAKYVGMGDFPGCTAPVTVMCLNGDGEWTADTVSDVVMHGDWEVDFISSQDGTCGLFEQ